MVCVDSIGVLAQCLFCQVPSSSPKFLEKSRGLKVDTIAYDLEDSVTLGNKALARENIVNFLGGDRPKGVGE